MKLLVCDAIDTMSRMSDRVLLESSEGITSHVEGLLDDAVDERREDMAAACLAVAVAIIKPLTESLNAATTQRHRRARAASY